MTLQITRNAQARASLNRQSTYELSWTAEKDYLPGSRVELRVHKFRALLEWRLVSIEMDGADFEYRWPNYPKTIDCFNNHTRAIMRARLPYGVRKGETRCLRLTVTPSQWAGLDATLSLWVAPGLTGFKLEEPCGEYETVAADTCTLCVIAGPVRRLMAYARSVPTPTGRICICICPQDHLGNPSSFARAVEATLSWEGESWGQSIEGVTWIDVALPATIGRLGVSVPLDALTPEENIGNGVFVEQSARIESNPVWADPPEGLLPAFGEFHWHTDFSGDGQRPIAEALRCARDELALDYAAPGDHNPHGDAWDETVAALDAANEDDRFATFFGWENSDSQGHENYYFTDPEHPLRCDGEAGVKGGGPLPVRDVLAEQKNVLAIPHHTNAVAETRREEDDAPVWQSYAFGEPTEAHRLFEIMQCRGNQEQNTYDDAWYGWHQNHGASFQDALARGWKLGVTGGTDNHCGWPGRAHAMDPGANNPPWTQSLTGVWTPALKRQNVFDSLYARCTWSAWNTRALVWFTLNDTPMGEEMKLTAGTALTARIRLSAEGPVQSMELVRDGRAVWQATSVSPDVDQCVQLQPAREDGCVYLRVLLRNGGILYASPVFWSINCD